MYRIGILAHRADGATLCFLELDGRTARAVRAWSDGKRGDP